MTGTSDEAIGIVHLEALNFPMQSQNTWWFGGIMDTGKHAAGIENTAKWPDPLVLSEMRSSTMLVVR
jgi:hypothetical protein